MIGYVEGRARDGVVVTPSGVGYEVRTPHPLPNGEVKLHVHTAVSENAIVLYGFENVQQKEVFVKLLAVRGVGPKAALAILGAGDIEYVLAGLSGNAPLKVKGVGPRTLDRIRAEVCLAGANPDAELVEALTALGFDPDTAFAAVKSARGSSPEASEDAVLSQAILLAKGGK